MGTQTREPISGSPRQRNRLRWGLTEFLRVPLLVVLGLAVLAGLAVTADRVSVGWLAPIRDTIGMVAPTVATSMMLQTVTTGLLTVVSIVFFVMVMAVQQQAGKYTTGVIDQFLQRRINQVFFGLFVGVVVYFVAVLTLVPSDQMVLSAAFAAVLAWLALPLLLVFIYNIFDQLRPSSAASMIAELALRARESQQPLLGRTRRTAHLTGTDTTQVTTLSSGYVLGVDVESLTGALGAVAGPVEIEFHVVVGSHLVSGDVVAEVRGYRQQDREQVASAVLGAVTVGRTRDVGRDANYCVDQLAGMAWTASSAQQDPEAASVGIEALHTLLASWGRERGPVSSQGALPIVYTDESTRRVLDALTAVIVATGQSGQHQTCSEVLRIFASMLPRLSPDDQQAAVDDIGRVLSTATGQVFTVRLGQAVDMLRRSLHESGFPNTAARLDEFEAEMTSDAHESAPAYNDGSIDRMPSPGR